MIERSNNAVSVVQAQVALVVEGSRALGTAERGACVIGGGAEPPVGKQTLAAVEPPAAVYTLCT